MRQQLQLTALPNIPLVEPGDDLCVLIMAALDCAQEKLQAGDVLVLAQKIVSKSENRYVYLNAVTPSERAIELAKQADKDR
jgi:coenzyme F420-0:L-glutamate ligase / coenzyme F420-1:gamma-L-glutamate ligase